MLHQLRDGCCCATVLADAAKEKIAKMFGTTESLAVEQPTNDADLVVTSIDGTPWSMVWFAYRADLDDEEGDIDSDPLVRQATSALSGEVPSVVVGRNAPVTAAAKISEICGCQSLGIWASDQGDGIGGGALFEAGRFTDGMSAAGAKELALIREIRDKEDADEEIDELLEALEVACDGMYWRLQGGRPTQQEGEIDEAFNGFMSALGLDSERCLELYDELLYDIAPADSCIVRSISQRSW